MKLKVCGMREPENIHALVELNPDYMGFIFWAPSRRYVDQPTPKLPASIKKVGVFVDASLDYLQTTIREHSLDAVQLHGTESPAYCALIKEYGVEVIKAFSVRDQFDFSQLKAYEASCDFFLFDTKGSLPGGNGTHFDWTLLKDYPSQKPFFLSGGIGPEDNELLQRIINTPLPLHAIDVNSKFERAPGNKNIELLTPFKKQLDEL